MTSEPEEHSTALHAISSSVESIPDLRALQLNSILSVNCPETEETIVEANRVRNRACSTEMVITQWPRGVQAICQARLGPQ